jgi:subtilisin family serine protease
VHADVSHSLRPSPRRWSSSCPRSPRQAFGRTLAPFSNWGPAAVPVAAPGERILTTSRDGRYAYAWGTSLAAPHVTGVAALVASISPGISAVALRAALVDHAAPGSAAERPRILDAPASVRSVR